jgi:tripartite-type tricarboxylate transporter receptor subunit TctC
MTQSLLGGFTPIACAIGNAVLLIKDGKIRALAITSKSASKRCPMCQPWTSWHQDQEAETMTGVFLPAGTPKPIVELLQTEI